MAIRLINSQIQDNPEQEKTGKSFDFPALVDYGEKISNYMFGLQVLQTFSESIKEENVSDSLI